MIWGIWTGASWGNRGSAIDRKVPRLGGGNQRYRCTGTRCTFDLILRKEFGQWLTKDDTRLISFCIRTKKDSQVLSWPSWNSKQIVQARLLSLGTPSHVSQPHYQTHFTHSLTYSLTHFSYTTHSESHLICPQHSLFSALNCWMIILPTCCECLEWKMLSTHSHCIEILWYNTWRNFSDAHEMMKGSLFENFSW